MHKRKGVWLQARGRAALQAAAGHWLWHVTSAQESSEEEGSVEWKGSSFEEQSLLHALQNVNEKQKKCEDRLLGIKRKKKKKSFQFHKTRRRHTTEASWNLSPGTKSNTEKQNKTKKGWSEGKPRSRKVKIHTKSREKQVCVIGDFLQRTNWPVRNKDLRCTAETEKGLVRGSRNPSQWDKWQWHALCIHK